MVTDPRAWLAEAQERAIRATEGPWKLIGGGEYITPVGIMVAPDDGGVRGVDAEFIANARTEHPAMAAALLAVLQLCRDMHAAHEYDPHGDAIAYEVERTIKKHLSKEEA